MSLLRDLPPEAYRTILEGLPVGVYLVDRDRRILLWNDGAEKITGYRCHEVIGRRCADDLLMHCDEKNDILCGIACPLHDTIHDGRPRDADVFLRHKDGQRVPVRVRAFSVRDDDGAIIGACECFDERELLLSGRHRGQVVEPLGAIEGVTQLPDRHAMLRRIQANLADFLTTDTPFGVLCLAIDNLDGLRAADGAPAVNSLLYATAQTLAKNIGPDNLVGRWSDRGFLAILWGSTDATLLEAALTLQRLASLEAVPWWGDRLTITLSAGVAVARAGDTPEELVRRAEEALDGSMRSGVNQAAVV